MKKIFTFLLAIFLVIPTFAQKLPEQRQFLINTQTGYYGYLSGDSAYFQQKRFITGNHWGNSSILGKAVGYNQMDLYSVDITRNPKTDIQHNSLLFVKMLKGWNPYPVDTSFFTHCQGGEPLNARGIEYSPILTIDTNLLHTLQTVPTSLRNPIFGFQTMRGTKDTLNDCLLIDNSFFTHYLHQ